VGGGCRLGHPDRQKRQGPVGLADDEVIGANMTLGADNGDHLAAAGWNGYVIRTSNAGHPAV